MAGEGRVDIAIRRQVSPRSREEAITRLAQRQHRVVTRAQLRVLGLSPQQIDRRVRAARLFVRYRGVYIAGPGDLTDRGEWLAATLYAGAGAAISHHAAAGHLGVRPWHGGTIDLTVRRRVSAPAGLRIHRSDLPPDERWVRDGVPLTSPARTILDLAAGLDVRAVERLIAEAHVARLPLRPSLATLIRRYPGRRGIATLRAALASFADHPGHTRSEFEERFLAFLDRNGFPRPLVNPRVETHIGSLEVDFLWPRERVVIELDGFASHGLRPAFRHDRRRDRALRLAGLSPSRLVWEDLDDEGLLAREVHGLLGLDACGP